MLPRIERKDNGGGRRGTEEALHLDLAAGQRDPGRCALDRIGRLLAVRLAHRLDHDAPRAGLAQHVAHVAGQDGARPNLDEYAHPVVEEDVQCGFELHGLADVAPPMLGAEYVRRRYGSRHRRNEALMDRQRSQPLQFTQQRSSHGIDQGAVERIVEIEAPGADPRVGRGLQHTIDVGGCFRTR